MKTTNCTLYSYLGLLLLVMVSFHQGFGQDDATWWNETHHWDGITPWQDYMIYSPAYMGPNALSVPCSQKGIVKDRYEVQIGVDGHFSKGDQTQDVSLRMYYPLIMHRVAIELYGVPAEHYAMNEKTVIERRSRHRDGSGFSAGDLYFSTLVQVIRNKRFPDIVLRMACKTASGGMLSDARFTDAPGYFFDISAGKDFMFDQSWLKKIRIHAMAGFYSWQMNLPNNQQNDALLYGAGVDIVTDDFKLETVLEGYSGYFGKRGLYIVDKSEWIEFNDRPMLWRTQLVKETRNLDVVLGYRYGLNDFGYQTINFSLLFHWE